MKMPMCAALTALFFAGLQVQAAAPVADKAAIKAAIASPDRLPSDREEDTWREAEAVLEFAGARPGMQAVDVISAGGYFTELLSRVAGPTGSVTAQNPMFFVGRLGPRLQERYGNNRLPNVKRLETEAVLALPANSYDTALLVNVYHDQYVKGRVTEGAPPPPAPNPAPFVAEVFKSMKSGGVVLVQDHAANAGGSPVDVASALHRVDPEVVKKDFVAAGFVFDGESSALRNTTDDHSARVQEQGILHKTDRFILRFRKP